MPMLKDRVAIITGASSGIGRAMAMLFASEGAAVVVNARTGAALEAVAAAITDGGGRARAVAGNAADADTHAALTETALTAFGRLDIAVNNAGTVGPVKPLAEITAAEWEEVLSVNLTAAFLGARSQIPAMLDTGGGAILFTSSVVGAGIGLPGMAAYAAAKAGLTGLVKGLTADYAARGIRANALLPGGVDTPMAGDDAQKEWAAGLHALKRIARPEEIAQAALFLVGPMASFVAGTAFFADGGNSAVK